MCQLTLRIADMSVTNEIDGGRPKNLSRRDQRKVESRDRLMAAARKLFVERGYHDTRPQDISREAGVGHGTFYLYFSDKRDCFQAFVERTHKEIQGLVQPEIAKCGNAAERVYATLKVSMEYSEQNPGVLRAAWAGQQLLNQDTDGTLHDMVEQWASGWAVGVRRGQERGVIWTDYDPDIIGKVILMVTSVVTMPLNGTTEEKQRYLQNLTKFVVRALVAPDDEGLARIIDGPNVDGKVRIRGAESRDGGKGND